MSQVPVVLSAPSLLPPKVSLVSSAEVITHSEERFGLGITWRPDGTPQFGVAEICDPSDIEPSEKTDPQEFDPFEIIVVETASTYNGLNFSDFVERATKKLLAYESYLIEGEFFTNSLALPNNVPLKNASTTLTSGGISPLHALALADQAASGLFGERALIHVRPGLIDYWAYGNTLRREGSIWLTPSDNIIVPGRGYAGTGPADQAVADDSEWIYVTAPVQVHRGPVKTTPDNISEATERTTNSIQVLASRTVAVTYDNTKLHAAIEVDPSIAP